MKLFRQLFEQKILIPLLTAAMILLIAKIYLIDQHQAQRFANTENKLFISKDEFKQHAPIIKNPLGTSVDDNQKKLEVLSKNLENKIAALEKDINDLHTQPSQDLSHKNEKTRVLSFEEKMAKVEADTENQILLLELSLSDGQDDPQWSSSAESSIQTAFSSQTLESVNFTDANCGSTLCKIDLSLTGDKSPGESYRDILDQVPWQGHGFVNINEETGDVQLYLAKEGHKLPKIDPQQQAY